jgi:hypothetical protein
MMRSNAGFALVELQVAIALLVVGLLGLAGATTVGMSTMGANRENARAMQAALRALESIESGRVPFESLFASFHGDPGAGPGDHPSVLDLLPEPAPGDPAPLLSRHFDVPGLRARDGDPDGRVGEVILPVADGSEGPELREDVALRDLNGDGALDVLDHADDYVLLPVVVRLEWTGPRGPRQIELRTLLTRR